MSERPGNEGPQREGFRVPWRRLVFLVAAAIGMYLVWPRLMDVFAAAPGLAHVSPLWFVAMFVLETASFASYWGLMRITLHEPRWSVVATTQLASNAFSRLVPGGAVSGGPASYSMLVAAGAPRARTITGLAANTLLSTAVLLALPILSVPAIIVGGLQVSSGLSNAVRLGAAIFGLIIAAGALGLFTNRPLMIAGAIAERIRNRLRPHHPPLTGLPQQLIEERDLIRSVLGDSWWKALGFAAGNWLLDYTALLAAVMAVGARPKASLVLLAYVVAALLGMVPITPGGLGFVEIGLTAALGLAGVGAAEATLATLMYRLVSFWLPIPAGGLALLFARRYVLIREAVEPGATAAGGLDPVGHGQKGSGQPPDSGSGDAGREPADDTDEASEPPADEAADG
jgi:uncharacterized protein (TIRG00374 family)